MRIRNLEIGKGLPCRIIAELGTLHMSSYENMMQATRAAIDSGADMVKVQMINWETAWWAREGGLERYKRLQWPLDLWEKYLIEANSISDVPVFSSIFDLSYLTDRMQQLMPAWKLGYKALSMPNLVDKVVKTKVPVLISIGGLDDPVSVHIREEFNLPNVLFQYVQPVYPLDSQQLLLPRFGAEFRCQGLSIHSYDFAAFSAAMVLGAQTLELHVQGNEAEGPDTAFALSIEALKKVVALRNKTFESLQTDLQAFLEPQKSMSLNQ